MQYNQKLQNEQISQTCEHIVWDECMMAHKNLLEELDRTLKDLRGVENTSAKYPFYCLGIFDKLCELYHEISIHQDFATIQDCQ